MQLPDEAVEAAAIEYETQIFGSREDVSELTHRAFKADAKRILEAAAPFIAARALRDAADYADHLGQNGMTTANILRDKARRLEAPSV